MCLREMIFWAHRSSGIGRRPWLASFKAKVTSCTKGSDEWGQVTCSDAALPESNVTCFCPPWANSLDSFTICALLNSLSFSVFIYKRWDCCLKDTMKSKWLFQSFAFKSLSWWVPKALFFSMGQYMSKNVLLTFYLRFVFESIAGKLGKYSTDDRSGLCNVY